MINIHIMRPSFAKIFIRKLQLRCYSHLKCLPRNSIPQLLVRALGYSFCSCSYGRNKFFMIRRFALCSSSTNYAPASLLTRRVFELDRCRRERGRCHVRFLSCYLAINSSVIVFEEWYHQQRQTKVHCSYRECKQ